MKKSVLIIVVASLCALAACTKNQRAKEFGGNTTIKLPAGQKLETATWKEANLWYLTRPRRTDEKPETHTFTEDSNFGVWKGTVIFQETE